MYASKRFAAIRRKHRSSTVAFVPTDITGLAFWIAADSETYQNSALTTPATSNNHPIGGWKDKSSNARHMVQATSGNRPLLKTNQINGKPGIYFSGSTEEMAIASSFTINEGTVFLVLNADSDHSNTELFSNSTRDQYFPRLITTPAMSILASGESQNTCSSISAFAGAYVIKCIDTNGTTPRHFHNGTQQGSWSGTTAAAITLQNLSKGASYKGYIAEIVLYDSVLSATDRGRVTSYLGTKYAITVS